MLPHIKSLKNIEIKKARILKRATNLFNNTQIDMLYLIPKKTNRNYEILVTKFNKNNEEWLRCWYCHSRGSGKQLEIKRYAKIKIIGCLLGQYQAEGTKNKNSKYSKCNTSFTNKSIEEHKNFMSNICNLGINKNKIITRLKYNPDKISSNFRKTLIGKFIKSTNLNPKSSISSKAKSYGFETTIRNTLLFEIINYGLKKIKENLIKQECSQNIGLFDSFFSKLLTGDGSIEYKLRYKKGIQSRIKISEGDKNERNKLKKILKKKGFLIHTQNIDLKSYCKFKDLLYLYKIQAFKNTINWYKLITLIGAYIEKRRIPIDTNSNLFKKWKIDLENLKKEKNLTNYSDLLESLKTKSYYLKVQ